MELNDSVGSSARRSLRAGRNAAAQGTPAAAATPVGSESPRSDASEGRASRSSRLSNPEFAAKHKAFMAKVTAATKGSMDTYLTAESAAEAAAVAASAASNKRRPSPRDDDQKRRRSTRTNSSGLDIQNDGYCWICHKEGDVICCETCPRVFHTKCLQLDASPAEDWVCMECVLIMTADNMETRSRAMRLLTIDQLCTLLKHALSRMKSVSNVEPFLKPVDPLQFPAYKDYIACPMDLQSMERNIRRKQYGSTEAMLADCKWILHNCIIFNSSSSKLTSIAKSIVKVCKHEMQEIENCPDCYLNAHIKKEVWFTEACRFPHPLVWAKLKGFPFWPGKVMRVNSENQADIRFFGAHDRAWIPVRDVFLFSKRPPADIKKKRGNLDSCFKEVEAHMTKLRNRFGRLDYAEHRTPYDPSREEAMLKILFPNYTLPFEIGNRRPRTYSFTGSERSRDATPTPSEVSGYEDEEEEEEETTTTAEQSREPAKIILSLPKDEKSLAEDDAKLAKTDPEAVEAEILHAPLGTKNRVEAEAKSEPDKAEHPAVDAETTDLPADALVIKDSCYEKDDNISLEPAESASLEASAAGNDKKIVTESAVEAVLDCDAAVTTMATAAAATADDEDAVAIGSKRTTVSPPCEVSSTTQAQETILEEEEKATNENTTGRVTLPPPSPRIVEGVIADSNNERVLFEDDEIDDVEPADDELSVDRAAESSAQTPTVASGSPESDLALATTGTSEENTSSELKPQESSGEGKEVEETPSASEAADKEEHHTEDKKAENQTEAIQQSTIGGIDTAALVSSGVISISVVDRALPDKDANQKEEGKTKEDTTVEDISVTVVERKKRPLSPSATIQPAKRSVDDQPRTEAEEDRSQPEPIVTISKVKVRERAVASPDLARRTPVSSPAVQSPGHPTATAAVALFAQQRSLPTMRTGPPPHMGPRGVSHMMMGQYQGPSGFLMRGPFRGSHPPGPLPLPSLQPRPVGPLSLPPSLPSAAGPVAEQLNRAAGKLAEYVKHSLEDLFQDLSQQGQSPEATIKSLQLECEKMAWRHQQELAEVKHNADLVLMEMRGTLEQEKQRALMDCRKQAEIDKLKAVAEAKKKQWCANCGKEAIFYCCWNTSYCDYPCQQAHWPAHMTTCSQNSEAGGSSNSLDEESSLGALVQQGHLPPPYQPGRMPVHPMVGALGGGHLPLPHHSQHHHHHQQHQARMAAAATMAGMRFGMRPNLPSQMAFTRPYFM